MTTQQTNALEAGSTLNSLMALAQGWERDGSDEPYPFDTPDWWTTDKGKMIFIHKYQPSDHNKAQAFELALKFNVDMSHDHFFDEDTNELIYSGFREAECYSPITNSWWRYEEATLELAICKAVVASVWGDSIPGDVMEKVRG